MKYHPISKIEADHLMILPVGTKVSIHGLKTRTELNNTFGCITEVDLSKQRYNVNLLTDGSCIAVKFENVAVYEESKADNPHEGFTRFEEINQPVHRVGYFTSTKVSDIFEDNGPVYRSKKACSLADSAGILISILSAPAAAKSRTRRCIARIRYGDELLRTGRFSSTLQL